MRIRLATRFVIAATLAALPASAQSPAGAGNESMTYEQFMRDHSLQERFAIFSKDLSPEKKAFLIGTHYARCLAALGAKLTPEQTTIVHDAQAALSPDVFRMPPVPGAVEKMRDVEVRARASFSQDLGVQFFTLEKECTAE